MTVTVTMMASGAKSGFQVQAQSGNRHTADANGFITGVALNDVDSIFKGGRIPTGQFSVGSTYGQTTELLSATTLRRALAPLQSPSTWLDRAEQIAPDESHGEECQRYPRRRISGRHCLCLVRTDRFDDAVRQCPNLVPPSAGSQASPNVHQ
jgi:hypothetical protein